MKGKLFTLFMFSFLLLPKVNIAQEITIDVNKPKKVAPIVYGFHYEEIGMIGEGGLYAEMVRNRGFEEANLPKNTPVKNGIFEDFSHFQTHRKKIEPVDPLIGWLTTPLPYSPIKIERTDFNPLNENTPHSMHVVLNPAKGYEGAAIHNTGFYGMCFRKGDSYDLSFYIRPGSFQGKLKVRLSDKQANPISEEKQFEIVRGKEWIKLSAQLISNANEERGMLSIIPEGIGSFQLDMVSMFPGNTWDDGKSVFRKDIMQNLADYSPDFLRFPGGCIVHGMNEQTMYHWKETIGDISRRPGAWSKWAPYYRTDGLGYHEFYELCEYLGADAMYVTSVGMVCTEFVNRDKDNNFKHLDTDVQFYINDALDAIEYAIGDVTSKWGAERAKNGHPEPFPLKYIEIGNEDFGPEYYKRYEKFYNAIKAKYPQLKLIANSRIGKAFDNKRIELPNFTDQSHIEIFDEHYYQPIEWVLKNLNKFDQYSRKGPDVFIGELGIDGSYPNNILGEGIFKLQLERNADLNPILADRPLMRNWDFIQPLNTSSLLLHNTSSSVKTFNYYLCKLFRDNKIDKWFPSSHSIPDVYMSSGLDSQTGDYVVKIINLSNTEKDINIRIPTLKNGYIKIYTLTSDESRVTPDNLKTLLEETPKAYTQLPYKTKIAAHSLTVFRINKKNK